MAESSVIRREGSQRRARGEINHPKDIIYGRLSQLAYLVTECNNLPLGETTIPGKIIPKEI